MITANDMKSLPPTAVLAVVVCSRPVLLCVPLGGPGHRAGVLGPAVPTSRPLAPTLAYTRRESGQCPVRSVSLPLP